MEFSLYGVGASLIAAGFIFWMEYLSYVARVGSGVGISKGSGVWVGMTASATIMDGFVPVGFGLLLIAAGFLLRHLRGVSLSLRNLTV